MKPTPRILLGQRLFWTEKEDGSCMTLWMKKDKPKISSRNQEDSAQDLKSLVERTPEYPKFVALLEEHPQFHLYIEACKRGRSITGIKVYERDICFLFDILDTGSGKFLPYINVHQHAFHHNIPVVGLWAETRHRSMKDLLKYKNYALKYCEAMKFEGVVIKAYRIPERFRNWHGFDKGMIQAKVKLDIPEPKKRKISKGEPILPRMPENEVMGAIDKVWQELGDNKFLEPKTAMPLIAQEVKKAMIEHFFSKPEYKFYFYYNLYIERRNLK